MDVLPVGGDHDQHDRHDHEPYPGREVEERVAHLAQLGHHLLAVRVPPGPAKVAFDDAEFGGHVPGAAASEHQNLVGLGRPVRQLRERAAPGPVDHLLVAQAVEIGPFGFGTPRVNVLLLNLALDKKALVQDVLCGMQTPAHSYVPPMLESFMGYRPPQMPARDLNEAS